MHAHRSFSTLAPLASPKHARWQKIDVLLESCHRLPQHASRRTATRPRETATQSVATVAYDAVNPFELAVAAEVFGFARPELGVPWYRFWICAVEPRPIRTSVDMLLSTPYGLEHIAEADIVIVPSSRPGIVAVPAALLEALRQAYRRGARLIGFCTGAFVLAAAGLLDGRRVTTHWLWAAELAARYPSVHVDR